METNLAVAEASTEERKKAGAVPCPRRGGREAVGDDTRCRDVTRCITSVSVLQCFINMINSSPFLCRVFTQTEVAEAAPGPARQGRAGRRDAGRSAERRLWTPRRSVVDRVVTPSQRARLNSMLVRAVVARRVSLSLGLSTLILGATLAVRLRARGRDTRGARHTTALSSYSTGELSPHSGAMPDATHHGTTVAQPACQLYTSAAPPPFAQIRLQRDRGR
jgi:hypothetical protein